MAACAKAALKIIKTAQFFPLCLYGYKVIFCEVSPKNLMYILYIIYLLEVDNSQCSAAQKLAKDKIIEVIKENYSLHYTEDKLFLLSTNSAKN